jgi:hypothetical protein
MLDIVAVSETTYKSLVERDTRSMGSDLDLVRQVRGRCPGSRLARRSGRDGE